MVSVNTSIEQLTGETKEHLIRMVDELDALRLWATLKIPKIEDGNNFSVSVQEEIIQLLAGGRAGSLQMLDSMTKHLEQRGEIVAKARIHAGRLVRCC